MRYRWYEEDLAKLFQTIRLPAYHCDYDISRYYKTKMKEFFYNFDNMIQENRNRSYSDEFYKQLKKARVDIRRSYIKITKIFSAYDSLDFKKAQLNLDILMNSLVDKIWHTSINGVFGYNPRLFRIRGRHEREVFKKPADLFHIPFSKRNLISNERYSLSGHPCLYLATSLGIAWEECGCPAQFYYSQFKYEYKDELNTDWKFITFISPQEFSRIYFITPQKHEEETQLNIVINYLITYPLIFACSIVNLSGDSVFKQEYIIPQMLLQWVQRHYGKIHGIIYFSCVATDSIRTINGYNIVVPANDFDRRGFGKNLTSKFMVSKPRLCNNSMNKEKVNRVTRFTNELQMKINSFPEAAIDCVLAMYDISKSFCLIISNKEMRDMKIVVAFIRLLRDNVKHFLDRFSKSQIIREIEEEKIQGYYIEKLDLFGKFYDRFITEIKDNIEEYDTLLLKVSVLDETKFFKI